MSDTTMLNLMAFEIKRAPQKHEVDLESEDIAYCPQGYLCNKEEICKRVITAMKNCQAKATTHKSIPFHITIWIGPAKDGVQYYAFIEITSEGFYVYPHQKGKSRLEASKILFEGHRECATFVTDAAEAIKIHMDNAKAQWEKIEAKKEWMKRFTKEEYLEVNRLKRAVKKESNSDIKADLMNELKDTQNKLNRKRAEGREHPEYKALLFA